MLQRGRAHVGSPCVQLLAQGMAQLVEHVHLHPLHALSLFWAGCSRDVCACSLGIRLWGRGGVPPPQGLQQHGEMSCARQAGSKTHVMA